MRIRANYHFCLRLLFCYFCSNRLFLFFNLSRDALFVGAVCGGYLLKGSDPFSERKQKQPLIHLAGLFLRFFKRGGM